VNQDSIWKNRTIVLCSAIVSLIAVVPPSFGQTPVSPWPMVQHDSARSGRSPYNTSANNGTISWKFAGGAYCEAPAIAADGTIYAACRNLYALRPDGTSKWTYVVDPGDRSNGNVDSSPAIATDGTIYFVSSIFHPERPDPGRASAGTQFEYSLSAVSPNGKLKWKLNLSTHIPPGASPIIGKDGTIYTSGDDYLYAVKPGGKFSWKFSACKYGVSSAPAIGLDGDVFFGCLNEGTYALSPAGTLKWKYVTGHVRDLPAVGADGTIYVSSTNDSLYALDPQGTLKWKFETGNMLIDSPSIGADGSIYLVSDDHNLYLLNPDGKPKAKIAIGEYFDRAHAPVISADGVIYIDGCVSPKGSAAARCDLVALSPDGRFKWKFSGGAFGVSSAAIGSDGTVYADSQDGHVYAFGPATNHH
jgi:outer membrane protein assembly factor BamB